MMHGPINIREGALFAIQTLIWLQLSRSSCLKIKLKTLHGSTVDSLKYHNKARVKRETEWLIVVYKLLDSLTMKSMSYTIY